jgi:hypothetical protein
MGFEPLTAFLERHAVEKSGLGWHACHERMLCASACCPRSKTATFDRSAPPGKIRELGEKYQGLAHVALAERETGLEPATSSLENSRSAN